MSEPDRLPFLPAWLDAAGLDTATFRVLLRVWRRAGINGECTESIANMARGCRLSELITRYALDALVVAGAIKRRDVPGKASILRVVATWRPGSETNPVRKRTPYRYEPGGGSETHRAPGSDPKDKGTPVEGTPLKVLPSRAAARMRRRPPAKGAHVHGTANGNGAGKETNRPGWVTLAGDALKAHRDGTGDYGRIGKELAPLVRDHGEAEVLARWSRYVEAPGPYYGPHAFAVDFGRWSAAPAALAAAGGARRSSVGEQQMAEAAKFLKGGRA